MFTSLKRSIFRIGKLNVIKSIRDILYKVQNRWSTLLNNSSKIQRKERCHFYKKDAEWYFECINQWYFLWNTPFEWLKFNHCYLKNSQLSYIQRFLENMHRPLWRANFVFGILSRRHFLKWNTGSCNLKILPIRQYISEITSSSKFGYIKKSLVGQQLQ